jgi:glycerophosphoryl diester phosphodiesterase
VPANEYLAYYRAGIDGVFADFPDDAFAARVQFLLDRNPALLGCLTGATSNSGRQCVNILP